MADKVNEIEEITARFQPTTFIASVMIPEERDRAIVTCDGKIYNVPINGPVEVFDAAITAFTSAMSIAKSLKQEETNHG